MRRLLFFYLVILIYGCKCADNNGSPRGDAPVVDSTGTIVDIRDEVIPDSLLYKPTEVVIEKKKKAEQIKEQQKAASKYNKSCDDILKALQNLVEGLNKNPSDQKLWDEITALSNDPYFASCRDKDATFRVKADALVEKLPD